MTKKAETPTAPTAETITEKEAADIKAAQLALHAAELALRNVILSAFVAHRMAPTDQIAADGTIIRIDS